MSEKFSIKTEQFANVYKPQDSTKFENFTNMKNDIKEEDGLDWNKMEEFLPEDSPNIFSPSSFTWKSDERTEVITHDEVHQHHLTTTITPQIFLPKLEIMDDSKQSKVNDNKEEDSRNVFMVPNEIVRKCKEYDKNCIDKNTKKSQHKCEICGRCYSQSNTLREHITKKHPLSLGTNYICEICNKRFTTQAGLEGHTQQKHPAACTHICEICGGCYKEDKFLRIHLKNQHSFSLDTEYVCDKCDKRFITQIGLRNHSNLMHTKAGEPTEHKCELCGRCYTTSKLLRAHLRNKHTSSADSEFLPKDSPNIYSPSSLTWKSDDSTEVITHDEVHQHHLTTTITPQIFLPKLEIMDDSKGIADTENKQSKVNDNREDSHNLRSKHPSSADSEFLPEDSPNMYSPSSFTWKSDDRTEVISHDEVHQHHLTTTITPQIFLPKLEIMDDSKGIAVTENKPSKVNDNKEDSRNVFMVPNEIVSKCKEYDKNCNDKNTKKSQHKCEICGRCYSQSNTLREHIIKKHPLSLDTNYICEICNKRFTTPAGLEGHTQKKHPAACHHICEICGGCYKEDKFLRIHLKDQHSFSLDTEYACDKCDKRFITQIGLDNHSNLMHTKAGEPTEHKCQLCGRGFTTSKLLRAHIRRKHPSSTDSEYICEICNQGFTTQRGLDKHAHWKHPTIWSLPPDRYKK
ncbi:uncharacterized protein isoform X1 [Musca autumnalis]|uniref:uncharacterized protein isoform X1 n=1 Tax=Musca autumnalis TaxID=221902 RepID=UPI003CE8FBA2